MKNRHFIFNNFFPKIVPVGDNVETYGRTRQATDDNIYCAQKMHLSVE